MAFFFRSSPPKEARELRDSLVSGGELDRQRIDSLIDILAASRVPFREDQLGRGLYRASYTRGKTPRWEKSRRFLPFLANKAGQIYNVDKKCVTNYAELIGSSCYFCAEGSYRAVGSPGMHDLASDSCQFIIMQEANIPLRL